MTYREQDLERFKDQTSGLKLGEWVEWRNGKDHTKAIVIQWEPDQVRTVQLAIKDNGEPNMWVQTHKPSSIFSMRHVEPPEEVAKVYLRWFGPTVKWLFDQGYKLGKTPGFTDVANLPSKR